MPASYYIYNVSSQLALHQSYKMVISSLMLLLLLLLLIILYLYHTEL